MVCEPLKYADFCQNRALVQHLSLGLAVSLVSSADHFLVFLFRLVRLNGGMSDIQHMITTFDVNWAINVFTSIKMMVMKTAYSIVVIKLALKTKASLSDSETMAANQAEGERQRQRKALHRRLFHFSLIPLFLNFLFLVYEIFDIGLPFVQHEKRVNDCVMPHLFDRFGVKLVITAVVFTVGSFSYVVGCLLLFPKVREAISQSARSCLGQSS